MVPTQLRVNFMSAVKYSSAWISVRERMTVVMTTIWTMRTTTVRHWETSNIVAAALTCKYSDMFILRTHKLNFY